MKRNCRLIGLPSIMANVGTTPALGVATVAAADLNRGGTLSSHSRPAAEKMTRLALLVLSLAALLGPGLAVRTRVLNAVVNQLLNRFKPNFEGSTESPIFTLAVRVPPGNAAGEYDVSQVPDDGATVRDTILTGHDIYTSQTMVAATVLKPEDGHYSRTQPPVTGHAENRVLQSFHLQPQRQAHTQRQELMVFYCSSSPCYSTCTNPRSEGNILESIRSITAWNNRVLVFTKLFHPPTGTPYSPAQMERSLRHLGGSIGLTHIYRCSGGRCEACFVNNVAASFCLADS